MASRSQRHGVVEATTGTEIPPEASLAELLADLLARTGGPLTRAEELTADRILYGRARPRGKRR